MNEVENRKIIDLINILKSCLGFFFVLLCIVNKLNKLLSHFFLGNLKNWTALL